MIRITFAHCRLLLTQSSEPHMSGCLCVSAHNTPIFAGNVHSQREATTPLAEQPAHQLPRSGLERQCSIHMWTILMRQHFYPPPHHHHIGPGPINFGRIRNLECNWPKMFGITFMCPTWTTPWYFNGFKCFLMKNKPQSFQKSHFVELIQTIFLKFLMVANGSINAIFWFMLH